MNIQKTHFADDATLAPIADSRLPTATGSMPVILAISR